MKYSIDKLKEALLLLEVPEKASLIEIKKIYKDLLFKWHPDTCAENKEICNKKTRRIHEAYKLILNYCENYPISFTKEELDNNSPQDAAFRFWMERFGDDPLWR